MNTIDAFQYIQNSHFVTTLGQLPIFFGIFAQLVHIAGLLLVLTPILLINLRIWGVGIIQYSAGQLVQITFNTVLAGLFFLILSGLFMFLPSATLYEPNPAFWLKMQLFLVALILQLTVQKKITQNVHIHTWYARLIAGTLIVIWFLVGASGRAIGFLAA